MQKKILVDTNIFIHYSEGKPYAVSFFEKVRYNCDIQIYVLKDVYAEARVMSLKFEKIYNLIKELQAKQLYCKVELSEEERLYAEQLSQKCQIELGCNLDRTDRRIIAVAKTRKLTIFSKDNNLNTIARLECVKTL